MELCSPNKTKQGKDTPYHSYPKHPTPPSDDMKSMSGNSWPLSDHSKNGDTTSKDLNLRSKSSQTTGTFYTSKTPQKLNEQQARWSLVLSEYNYKLKNMPGNRMIQSSALSRWPDHIPENDENDQPTTLLKEDLFIDIMLNISYLIS